MRGVHCKEFVVVGVVLQALICTSFVPLYSGVLPPKYRGVVSTLVCQCRPLSLMFQQSIVTVISGHVDVEVGGNSRRRPFCRHFPGVVLPCHKVVIKPWWLTGWRWSPIL